MKRFSVSACLVALIVGQLLVGVVGATPLRHLVAAAIQVEVTWLSVQPGLATR